MISKFIVPSDKYKIASLDFLRDGRLGYDIKCIDYTIIYKMEVNQLV
jgi:hypothetical protein